MEEVLKRALVRNEFGKVFEILSAGKVPSMPPENIPEGGTVLHIAVMLGYKECVEVILSKAICDLMVNYQDEGNHWTPLMHAIANNDSKIAKQLLVTQKCDVTLKDSFKQTALHLEAQSHSITAEVCYYLVKYGAAVDAEDSEGMTPFLRAIEGNNVTAAKFLFNQRCDTSHQCSRGRTALHIAAQHCHEELVAWLIRICCSLSMEDEKGQTPLMVCVQQRKPPHLVFKVLKLLLDAGSDVNAQDSLKNTTLLLATSNPGIIRKHHIELLLASGADPSICNVDGLTPIWQAIYDGVHYADRMKVIELFLAQNCDLNTACRGRLLFMSGTNSVYSYEAYLSPFEVAMDSGLYDVARKLILAGAKVSLNFLAATTAIWAGIHERA